VLTALSDPSQIHAVRVAPQDCSDGHLLPKEPSHGRHDTIPRHRQQRKGVSLRARSAEALTQAVAEPDALSDSGLSARRWILAVDSSAAASASSRPSGLPQLVRSWEPSPSLCPPTDGSPPSRRYRGGSHRWRFVHHSSTNAIPSSPTSSRVALDRPRGRPEGLPLTPCGNGRPTTLEGGVRSQKRFRSPGKCRENSGSAVDNESTSYAGRSQDTAALLREPPRPRARNSAAASSSARTVFSAASEPSMATRTGLLKTRPVDGIGRLLDCDEALAAHDLSRVLVALIPQSSWR
jgi:hypothetical protein